MAVYDEHAPARFLDAKCRTFVRMRRCLLSTVCLLLSVAWSTRSDAQWPSHAGISAARARTGSPASRRVLSRGVADSARVDSASGVPRGAIGAVVGAVLGGVLGRRWELGLCDAPAAQCTGTHGAIGGALVGAALGFGVDWGLSGLRDSPRPRSNASDRSGFAEAFQRE